MPEEGSTIDIRSRTYFLPDVIIGETYPKYPFNRFCFACEFRHLASRIFVYSVIRFLIYLSLDY